MRGLCGAWAAAEGATPRKGSSNHASPGPGPGNEVPTNPTWEIWREESFVGPQTKREILKPFHKHPLFRYLGLHVSSVWDFPHAGGLRRPIAPQLQEGLARFSHGVRLTGHNFQINVAFRIAKD